MLSLFKENAAPIEKVEALKISRNLLVSSLNKGMIPTWDQFFNELPLLDSAEDLEAIKFNFLELTQWSFLNEILGMEGTEFFFHSTTSSQRMTFTGEKLPVEIPLQQPDWQLWLEIISIRFHQNWNVENPFASFYAELFGKKYRLSLIHSSTSPLGISKLIIRCLSSTPHNLTSFGEAEITQRLVKEKRNLMVAGSTGSGKTSLLTSLLSSIKPDEHLVVLEDTYEIISQHPHQTRFLAGDTAKTSLKAYLSYSLRLSPDRIILGEMRSHEVIPFVMAMNTGHRGLMGTLHVSSCSDALHRVALLFSLYSGEANLSFDKVMELICRNLEYVIFMEDKKVKEIIKILGCDKGVAFYENVMQSFAGGGEALHKDLNLF